jgi:hypothetical protein
MGKTTRNAWTYQEHEEQWEGAQLSRLCGVPSSYFLLGTWEQQEVMDERFRNARRRFG